MVLAAQAGSVEPGAEAETVVLVRNTGDAPDVFHVVVQGEAAPWSLVDPPSLSLAPGEEGPVWVHFRPPRAPDTVPGSIPFAVAVASSHDPDFVAVETGVLDVGTFSSVAASFSGETTVGARWTELTVAVRNTGNRRVRMSIGVEASGGVATEMEPESVDLAPGQPASFAVRIRPPRRLVPWGKEDRRVTVSVVSDGGALATLRTEYPDDLSVVNELVRSAARPRCAPRAALHRRHRAAPVGVDVGHGRRHAGLGEVGSAGHVRPATRGGGADHRGRAR